MGRSVRRRTETLTHRSRPSTTTNMIFPLGKPSGRPTPQDKTPGRCVETQPRETCKVGAEAKVPG